MSDPTIVCLSANPALDRRLHLSSLAPGAVNRALSVQALAGGKAAHVAMASRALGAHAVWIGFLGGAVGEECAAQLQKLDIDVIAVRTKAATRLNFEMIEDSGRITEVLEPGGVPTPDERDDLIRICAQGLRESWKGALVVISGSLPPDVPPQFCASLLESARAAGAKVFLDTSGEALRAGLDARPDLVKPNREEAELLLGHSLRDVRSAVRGTRELIERGAKSAAITLGAEGLVWIESKAGPAWTARSPHVQPISTVGCGDATLGGFAFAATQGMTGEGSLRLATACGAANCLADEPGRVSAEIVKTFVPRIEIRCLAL